MNTDLLIIGAGPFGLAIASQAAPDHIELIIVGKPMEFWRENPGQAKAQQFWSPYYRIDFKEQDLSLSVNLIYHQQMVSRNENFPAYALPHLLNRDAGRPAFADVLIIGAGSGNDVSR